MNYVITSGLWLVGIFTLIMIATWIVDNFTKYDFIESLLIILFLISISILVIIILNFGGGQNG